MKRFLSEEGQVFVETALVSLVVMLLALGLLQFGLYYHGQHVVLGAAQEGAHEAALQGTRAEAGEARARNLLRAGLGSLSSGVSVHSEKGERITTVSVAASMPAIVPFLPALSLRAQARALTERFFSPGKRP